MILLQISLVLHLAGLTLMAGTTVTDYITFNAFSKRFEKDRETALGLLDLKAKLSILLVIGAALLIFSGIGLFTITDGVFIHQLWFKIKLLLVLSLILNGFLFGGKQELKLKGFFINKNGSNFSEQMNSTILNLKIFYLLQMSIFFVIIFLSVFKFG